jgi:hypothetical protein
MPIPFNELDDRQIFSFWSDGWGRWRKVGDSYYSLTRFIVFEMRQLDCVVFVKR